nr:ORF6N domain-containing protein [Pseudoduganella danionis]
MLIRGQKVLLDAELAYLYGITTKRFNEQVKRNLECFPGDFMFRLTAEENTTLRSQNATSNQSVKERGGRRYLPFAFTEHGAIMAATILNSPRATQVSVYVVRAFVQLRELLVSNRELVLRLNELEKKAELMALQSETDRRDNQEQFRRILQTLRELMAPPMPVNKRPIGFVTPDE